MSAPTAPGFPINRRAAIKWVMAVSAIPLVEWSTLRIAAAPAGTPSDPDLLHPKLLWDKTLSADQLKTVAALCDVILPADERSPAASQLGVHDFIDEWVSAPFPTQAADRKIILGGIDWLNQESGRRFRKGFAALDASQKTAICDDICFVPNAKPAFKDAALFFAKARDLAVSAFYTTVEGMKDIQYIGNTPLATYSGPPAHVLARLGLQ
jgi:hypothetical protein